MVTVVFYGFTLIRSSWLHVRVNCQSFSHHSAQLIERGLFNLADARSADA